MTKKNNKKKRRVLLKRSIIYTLVVLVLITTLVISMTTKKGIIYSGIKKVLNGLGIYTEELRENTIETSNYPDPGSFKIDKSFEWIDYKKIKVTYDLSSKIKSGNTYKDVILVLDISDSMNYTKFEKAKEDIKGLIEYLLQDTNNTISLITFYSQTNVIATFSNDKGYLLEKVEELNAGTGTNYYEALSDVYDMMYDYTPNNNRDVVTVFITDGYPNEGTPNQKVMYEALKIKYPYMTINGIEFEMGNKVIPEVDEVTDDVWIADRDNLSIALFEAAVNPDKYEELIIEDEVSDYFDIDKNNISVSKGDVSVSDNKINWDLGNDTYSGGSEKMEVVLTIKDEYMDTQNYYPLSSKDTINYSLNNNSSVINDTDNLVTKNKYDVVYDVNTPEGCNLSSIDGSISPAYTNITKNQSKLYCGGYLFKGFEVRDLDNSDVTYINDDVFIMPGHDVNIKAVWTKQSVYKTMDGTVKTSASLYNVLKEQEGNQTLKYTGEHHDSYDREPDHDIYYYYADNNTAGNQKASEILDSNNVRFGGYCWQMIRTTDTGGVKMIYNGPALDDKCLSNRAAANFEGFSGYTSYKNQYLSTNYYYYGTDYTYDRSTKKFTLLNERNDINWVDNSEEILSTYKYTCMKKTANTLCDSIYYVVDADYDTNPTYYALALQLINSSPYYQIGDISFNGVSGSSLSDVGYKYKTRYKLRFVYNKDPNFLFDKSGLTDQTQYYYSSHIRYNTTTRNYELVNCDDDTLTNCTAPTSTMAWGDYKSDTTYNQTHHYTCFSGSNQCQQVYYVIDTSTISNHALSRLILGGNVPSEPNGTITLSKEMSSSPDGDGKYSLEGNSKITITRMDWYTNYSTYFPSSYTSSDDKYYYCKDYSDKCSKEDMRYLTAPKKVITSVSDGVDYVPINEIKYGNDFEYDGTEYTLKGTTYNIENYAKESEYTKLANAHYTCLNATGKCNNLAYITAWDYYSSYLYYISLSGGENISQAINKMLYDEDINTKDSAIKIGIDWWYERNLKDYSEYLEETIFCNDRSMRELGSWNPNGGSINGNSTYKFNNFLYIVKDLSCPNDMDKFSTSEGNSKAKLEYSIGLLTAPEAYLLGNNNIRKTGKGYFLMSPCGLGSYTLSWQGVNFNGSVAEATTSSGLRPVISLAPGIEYSEGDGSMDTPYVIDVE